MNRADAMPPAILDPAGFFRRLPLQPHQLTGRVTRTEDTIVLCHLGVPQIAPDAWSLTVDGLVHEPIRLTLGDLLSRPHAEVASVHQCAGSPLEPSVATRRICNVVWRGVRLTDLLSECGPLQSARFVWSFGVDHGEFAGVACEAYAKDLPIERVGHDVLVAYEMNGKPLRPENGFPVRLVVPGFYGTNSVKWLNRIHLAAARAAGPFTTRWYNDPVRDASGNVTGETTPVWAIAPEAVIVAPAPNAALARGGSVEVWGWAWGDGGIAAAEVSFDNSATWLPATLEPARDRSWQRFNICWEPERSGAHEIAVRARGRDGGIQPELGARNAIHRVQVVVT